MEVINEEGQYKSPMKKMDLNDSFNSLSSLIPSVDEEDEETHQLQPKFTKHWSKSPNHKRVKFAKDSDKSPSSKKIPKS